MGARLRILSGSAGFSLIELMITVGIIGILVTIAVPAYDMYQAKTRQSEAKVALAAIYVGEKSFQGEYSTYISSLEAIHYEPEGFKRFYTVGWSAAQAGTILGFSGNMGQNTIDRQGVPADFGCAPAAAIALLPPPVTFPAGNYTVGAIGEIKVGRGCDRWTIDDTKTIANPTPGY